MPGLPKVKTIRFLTYSGNTTADAAIEAGELDWAGAFIPNIKQTYLAKDPKYGWWTSRWPPLPGDRTWPPARPRTLAVRQAISAAIDRDYHQRHGLQRLRPDHQPRGPAHAELQARRHPAAGQHKFGSANPAQAKKILEAAGYNGLERHVQHARREAVNITVKMVASYTDYLSVLQIMQQELKAAGINLQITSEAYTVRLRPGHRQLPAAAVQRRLHPDPSRTTTGCWTAVTPADRQATPSATRPLQQSAGRLAARADRGHDGHRDAEAGVLQDRADLQGTDAAHPAVGGAGRDRVQRQLRQRLARPCPTRTAAPAMWLSSRTTAGSPAPVAGRRRSSR